MKDEELLAVCNRLSPPIQNITGTLTWFDEGIRLMLGIFANHDAAVIQTRKGTDSRYELRSCLRYLPNVKLVIGVGFAYGRRYKCYLGDVLISNLIDAISNFRIGKEKTIKFDESLSRHTGVSRNASNVFTKAASMWTGFKCSMADRESKAHVGLLISSPVLLDDREGLDDYLKNNERLIGGEMEGQEIVSAQKELSDEDQREVDVIIIKGVADFGDGTKEQGWQLTASMAAASYAESKLLATGGSVYKTSKFLRIII